MPKFGSGEDVTAHGSDLSVLRKRIKKPLCMNQDGVLETGLPTNSAQLIMETRTRTKHFGSARRCQGYLSAFSAGKEFLLF